MGNQLPDMGSHLGGNCLFSDLGQEVEVGYWVVVFEGVLVKCRFFKERCDNSLFKPVKENTVTEGKGKARIQVTQLGWRLGYEFPDILFG